jgi:hypothetical protein
VLGDGVAVPAVRFIRDRILEPILAPAKAGASPGELRERVKRRERAGPNSVPAGASFDLSL